MKAAINNKIVNLTHLYLALFVLMLGGTAPADVNTNEVVPAFTTSSTTHHFTSNAAVTYTVFHNDNGMPLAREDVDAVRVAVVPGNAYVPTTTPRYEPTYNSGYPQQVVPQYQNTVPQYQGQQYPQQPVPTNLGTPAKPEDKQLKITARATDPKMQSFLRSTSMRELTTLFHEASTMIDSRHVNPPSYESRTQSSINNLINALENDNFLRANGVNANANMIRQVQSELSRIANAQPARNANEAVGIMQWAAELVSRQLGLRREAVALEFMNGTIDSLDKYSAFMPESSSSSPGAEIELRQTASLEEKIVGIGVELETHPLGAILVGVVENSPASQLGLQERDLIVAVNQKSVQGLTLNEVASKLGGPSGTTITLDIERNGQRYRGSLQRRSIYVSSVSGVKMLDNATMTGYLRLKQFSESSRKDLEAAMLKLHNQGMKSLVLDLRGNPGGLLDQAIELSNLFLPRGTIVSTKGRNASDNTVEVASYEKTWKVPLVVLVDDGSASASEIFAAAIQDNGRGVIVGRHSYGKGTVQTHFPLRTVSGLLKLTTAKFYSPTGREMAGQGVTPDIQVSMDASDYRGANDADLNAALNTIQQGVPAQMAQNTSNNRQSNYQANTLTNTNYQVQNNTVPAWQRELQGIFKGH